MLIDSPVFTRARLHLLSPGKYPTLMRAMYSLLMLCPQSNSFNTLHARLSSVPTLALLKLHDASEDSGAAAAGDAPPPTEVQMPWRDMLQVRCASVPRSPQVHRECRRTHEGEPACERRAMPTL